MDKKLKSRIYDTGLMAGALLVAMGAIPKCDVLYLIERRPPTALEATVQQKPSPSASVRQSPYSAIPLSSKYQEYVQKHRTIIHE